MRVAGINIGKITRSAHGSETMLARARRLDELSVEIGEAEESGRINEKQFQESLNEFRRLRESTKGVAGLADRPEGRAYIDWMIGMERGLTDGLPELVRTGSKSTLAVAVQIQVLRALILGLEKLSATHKTTTVQRAMNVVRTWKPKGVKRNAR